MASNTCSYKWQVKDGITLGILPGDKVKIELSPYDLSKGRII